MKNLQLTIFLFCGIIFLKTENTFAQNLQFNQAVFNTYGPGNADGNVATPLFTGSLVVGANQVIKITSGACSSINAIVSVGAAGIPTLGILSINDFHYQLAALNQMEIWLPTGIYTVKGYEYASTISGGAFKGMISGVLYDIVP
jgi:hypothetical protein